MQNSMKTVDQTAGMVTYTTESMDGFLDEAYCHQQDIVRQAYHDSRFAPESQQLTTTLILKDTRVDFHFCVTGKTPMQYSQALEDFLLETLDELERNEASDRWEAHQDRMFFEYI